MIGAFGLPPSISDIAVGERCEQDVPRPNFYDRERNTFKRRLMAGNRIKRVGRCRGIIIFLPEPTGLKLVGATGFEPVTTRTPSVCATRLRYAPTPAQHAEFSTGKNLNQFSRK